MFHSCRLLAFALCVISATRASAGIPRYSSDPNDFVSAESQHFWVHNQPFRFTGFNLRGLCHYGENDILSSSYNADRETNLAYMQSVGARVARVFVTCRFADRYTVGNRLDATLAVAAAHDVYVIVAFTDEYRSGFCPTGDIRDDGNMEYYNYGSGNLLNQEWFNFAFQYNYLPMVEYLVSRFKSDPVVFAWQLGNELKCYWDPTDLLEFSHAVATRIRQLDSRHMVSQGTAGRAFCSLTWDQGVQLYQDFDFVTVHAYNGSDSYDDSGLASHLGKPLLVEEAGMSSDLYTYTERPARTDVDIAKWVSRGARGYMNWGLMATSYDNGDGDFLYGIDPVLAWKDHHLDWDAYTQVYTNWSQVLSQTSMPAPAAPGSISATDGDWPDRVAVNWSPSVGAAEYAVYRSQAGTVPDAALTAVVNLIADSGSYQECGHYNDTCLGRYICDGNLSTKWCCAHRGISVSGDHAIAFDLGSEAAVTQFVVRHASTGGEPTYYNTKTFDVESGPSWNGPWSTEFHVDNATPLAGNYLTLPSARTMRYVRLRVTKPNTLSYDWAVRIPEFEIWGTPGAQAPVQVSPWTTAAQFQDSSVERGVAYSYQVKARNEGGESPLSDPDTGFANAAAPVTLVTAKSMSDGSSVYVTGAVVTAAFGDGFYVEQPDRLSGLRVVWQEAVAEGQAVTVYGTLETVNGERQINALLVAPASTGD